MELFGQLLRQLRADAGLSQHELARAAGLSTRTVSDLERGINLTARKDTARLLADALRLAGPQRAGFEAAARGHGIAGGVAAATRTLPRDAASFTDRAGELGQLAAAGGAGGIYVIGGMAGAGKTAFAVHAAHQLAPLFPDGQIFLPMHAHAAGRRPVRPADALASLLQTIGIPPGQIPPSPESRASLWRDRLAGRQLLLLLDDAAGSDQIRPLLPGTAGILVLITSRIHLTALEDAHVISFGTLPPRDAAELLVRLATRPGLDPADPAVAEIARLCGRLPLALGMVARQLYHHPAWTVSAVAADLAAARNRPGLLHAENLSVAAAFDRSYQDLNGQEQRMFRCVGLHPGPDFGAGAAAALAGITPAEARRDLEGLYDHYLLAETAPGRYRFHELIREHARCLAATDPPGEREAAVTRLLDYYLNGARAAGQQLSHRPARAPSASGPATGPQPEIPGGRELALSWMGAERLNLHAAAAYAAASGRPGYAVAIPAAMHEFLRGQGHWDQAMALHHAALTAARDVGSRLDQARALTDLSDIQFLAGDCPAAAASLDFALELYRGLGDRPGEAAALSSLAAVQHAAGDSHAATASLDRALDLCRGLGDRPGEAAALTSLAAVQHATGDSHAATTSLDRALDLYGDLGSHLGQARALTQLGAVQYESGEHDQVAASQQRALELYRLLGDRLGEASTLTSLGTMQYLTGRHQDAEASHTHALRLYRDLDDRSGEAETLNNIADMIRASAKPGDARPYYDQALALATRIAAQGEQARALEGIGHCDLADGQPGHGRELLRQAMAAYQRIGSPRAHELDDLLNAAR